MVPLVFSTIFLLFHFTSTANFISFPMLALSLVCSSFLGPSGVQLGYGGWKLEARVPAWVSAGESPLLGYRLSTSNSV